MRVDKIMTRDVVSVRPDTPLKEVARLLVEQRISGVPVCDPAGRVLGVVSEADILVKEEGVSVHPRGMLGWLLTDQEESAKALARTAGEAMTSPAVTISTGRPVSEAARTMVERNVNRLPVAEGDRLVGIITRADLVKAFTRSDSAIAEEISNDVLLRTLWIDPAPIEITVENGLVTIGGRVATRSEAELIGAYVSRVPGVVDVDASELHWHEDDLRKRRSLVDVVPR
jgi:CBS domain-containing protein